MRICRLAFVMLMGWGATLAQAAGFAFIEVPADASGPALKAAVWTPCAAPPQVFQVGPFDLAGVRGCPLAGDHLPLVVFSHGHGGTALGHHDTAETLADAGFIVAALNHPGDTATDMSGDGDIAPFIQRPTDIKRLIDFMLGAWPAARTIDASRIGFFGFSRGGYTGLVIAGANPDFRHSDLPCPDPRAPICKQIREEDRGSPTHDPRVKAVVIVDPLSVFPTGDSLKDVKVPMQLWKSEFGGDGVLPKDVDALATHLPSRPDVHVMQHAGHFAFLAPCSAALTREAPEICIDAPGLDRAAVHKDFDAQVLAFFRTQLGEESHR